MGAKGWGKDDREFRVRLSVWCWLRVIFSSAKWEPMLVPPTGARQDRGTSSPVFTLLHMLLLFLVPPGRVVLLFFLFY